MPRCWSATRWSRWARPSPSTTSWRRRRTSRSRCRSPTSPTMPTPCTPRAVEAGATAVMPVANQFHGDRFGSLRDPFGHRWIVATHLETCRTRSRSRRSTREGRPRGHRFAVHPGVGMVPGWPISVRRPEPTSRRRCRRSPALDNLDLEYREPSAALKTSWTTTGSSCGPGVRPPGGLLRKPALTSRNVYHGFSPCIAVSRPVEDWLRTETDAQGSSRCSTIIAIADNTASGERPTSSE